jgi:hypothetical protein
VFINTKCGVSENCLVVHACYLHFTMHVQIYAYANYYQSMTTHYCPVVVGTLSCVLLCRVSYPHTTCWKACCLMQQLISRVAVQISALMAIQRVNRSQERWMICRRIGFSIDSLYPPPKFQHELDDGYHSKLESLIKFALMDSHMQ